MRNGLNGSFLDLEAVQLHAVTVLATGAGGQAVAQVFAIQISNVVKQQRCFLSPRNDTFIATSAFHRMAAELRITFDSTRQRTIVSGDADGDGRADFAIHLAGNQALTASDFYL